MSKKFKVRSRAYYRALAWHGGRFMDKKKPDWYTNIHKDVLDMADESACILGQGFGSFYNGRTSFNLSNQEAEMYGFFIADPDTYDNSERLNEAYSILTECWIEEVNNRLADNCLV